MADPASRGRPIAARTRAMETRAMDIRKAVAAMVGAALMALPGLALAQEPQSFKGMIVSTGENSIVVRVGAEERIVTLTPDTKITGTAGAGVLQRETRPPEDLIRGLPVEVKGVPGDQGVVAESIIFKRSDLKTAKQISAGISQTEGNVEANKKAIAEQEERLNNVGNLVSAGRTKVFFEVGKATLSDQGKQDLQTLAAKVKTIKSGYRLAVVGRADPTGDAAANQRLSARRAVAVKSYLIESAGVLPTQFIPSTALGENPVTQDPDPPRNAAEARRVSVTILVSKGSPEAE
jgi:outer membrane protein OmpA-like peptidoglycan-associated protein